MALLLFDDISSSQLSFLMDVTQRQATADLINPSILKAELKVAAACWVHGRSRSGG